MLNNLADICKKTSGQAYNTDFWNIYMEIYTEMNDSDFLIAYASRFEDSNQM